MTDILMPALSPTMEEGTLAKWLVAPGDSIKAGQVIAEIETDKATMEVEAVDEGVIESLLVPAGSEGVKVNAVIAKLKGEGEAASAPVAEPANVVRTISPVMNLLPRSESRGGCRRRYERDNLRPRTSSTWARPPEPARRSPHVRLRDGRPP